MESTTTTSSFPLAPAPWKCKGEIYWLFLNSSKEVKPGTYATLEGTSPPISSKEAGAPTGKGLGACVMIVRYSETPVGSYDELMYMPGPYTTPTLQGGDGKPHLRITRIYVSETNTATMYNGRVNWNIPKHPARFEFKELSKTETRISVYPPTSSNPESSHNDLADAPPFFSAIVSKARFLPSIPMSTTIVPIDIRLVQPPLPSAPLSNPALAGTDTWMSLLPVMKGKTKFIWVKPSDSIKDEKGNPQFGDGVGFPRIEPWSLGMHWVPGTVFDISPSTILGEESKKVV